jgi:hypothetical protein
VGVSNPSNHHTITHTGCRVIIRMEAQTCLNPRVSHVPLFITSMSTLSLESSHKSTIVGAHRVAHEMKLHENNAVHIYN